MSGTLAVGLLSALSLLATHAPESLRAAWSIVQPAPAVESVARARIPAGRYRPLYAADPGMPEVEVRAFELDVVPVTNRRFRDFVLRHPEWRRDRVSRLFVDSAYLSHWPSPTEIEPGSEERPVTGVSWFAAKAFCESVSMRLPTEAEWEYVARANETRADARTDRAWSQRILDWYSKPSRGPDRDVGREAPNFYGVRDMHGLAWEWVFDFNSSLVTADSRRPGDTDKNTFCGAGAFSSSRPEDYASFMRTALRSSLEARHSARHLGFRCAKPIQKETPS